MSTRVCLLLCYDNLKVLGDRKNPSAAVDYVIAAASKLEYIFLCLRFIRGVFVADGPYLKSEFYDLFTIVLCVGLLRPVI